MKSYAARQAAQARAASNGNDSRPYGRRPLVHSVDVDGVGAAKSDGGSARSDVADELMCRTLHVLRVVSPVTSSDSE